MVLNKKSAALALPFSSSSNYENLFLSPFDPIEYDPPPLNWQGDQFFLRDFPVDDLQLLGDCFINDPLHSFSSQFDTVENYPPSNWQGDQFSLQDFPIDDLRFLGDCNDPSCMFPQDNMFSSNMTLGNELEEHWAQFQEIKSEPMDFVSKIDEQEKIKIKSEMGNVDESSNVNKMKSFALLGKEEISQYFYMPIKRAARELNIGLTLLKKRCRELGIRRWPHRKLMSLQTLINNVEGMKREGRMDEAKVRVAIAKLENEKKLLEEMPDIRLQDNTKRLRQACFKANYKKRSITRKG